MDDRFGSVMGIVEERTLGQREEDRLVSLTCKGSSPSGASKSSLTRRLLQAPEPEMQLLPPSDPWDAAAASSGQSSRPGESLWCTKLRAGLTRTELRSPSALASLCSSSFNGTKGFQSNSELQKLRARVPKPAMGRRRSATSRLPLQPCCQSGEKGASTILGVRRQETGSSLSYPAPPS
ncbi:hypothetical protein NDU88_002504 [Pleurodeles waltl]|uniref:Uncharacterized protein n=1 Tax=Pleurodeles waltl TaxID=8319 RepID=A0AAV7TKU7_PLEWA|nr:hypothetical protein NDU88_002504 [Pleurodeles waltl]